MDRFVTGDGCGIAYRFDGAQTAPLLLLSNSLGTNMAMWEPQMAAFTRHFRVLRYDTRGHGQSDAPTGGYSLDRLGRDIVELLDALAISPVAFCGLSLGGMMGQWLGIREPGRIGKLILANTSSFMGPPSGWDQRIALVQQSGMRALVDATVSRWFTPDFIEKDSAAITDVVAMLLATDPQGYGGCCSAIRDMDMRRTARLIEGDVLVIGGNEDGATPPDHSRALTDAIGKNATLEMLDAAHLSNVEQPEQFAELCLRFLLDHPER
ncbi:3-oxoadipate enol-lactonase [Sphingobium yanoikuyae]|uniref:3-oxoadipate enol-lactonase n=1 Tax=Sphingobium yanoikuyae TaxID=13690 RepID=UPI0012D36DA0|nr:3-oxoadipate enol-lactonase [Sphingobium yanoikuyae]